MGVIVADCDGDYAHPMLLPLTLFFAFAAQAGPSDSAPLVTLTGIGVQIYTCGADSKWAFTAPEAALFREREQVGTHGAGPRWTWNDGSAVTGKVVTSTPSSDPTKNIPALELAVTPVAGTSGFLSPVTRITRTETQGGVAPPDGCGPGVRGETLRVPYAATYKMYAR